MSNASFYWRHLRTPLVMFALVALLLASTNLDLAVAHALFFDEARVQWIGAASWWTNELIHRDGAWLMRGIAMLSLLLWTATWIRPQLLAWRKPALYFFVPSCCPWAWSDC